MFELFPFFLCLTLAILLLVMLAEKIKVAYPIVLVAAGLIISFVPGLPLLHIESELIFVIFLPPLLYDAAGKISWKELWKWRRIICSFAFLVVLFSAFSVALAANYFIPGFSLALGFLLGGIVSPPDAVSTGAILKFVNVPKRIASILEGESLLNDASSLIIFRFALIAVGTGEFIIHKAVGSFVWMVAAGVLMGLLVGFIIMKLHKNLPTDANIDVILSLISPYLMYIAAEEIHSSGVLAVVAGGLYLANHKFWFLSSSSRLRGINVWDSLSFLLNGLVFMLIGLDLTEIISGLGATSIYLATGYGLMITFVLIFSRMLSAFMAVFVTLIARNFITVADSRHPGYKGVVLIGWSGMRGVVSLAAALSVPEMLREGTEFPQRSLILFITFIVILTTLLLQGLTLPYVIKKINMQEVDYTMSEEEMYHAIRQELNAYALEILERDYDQAVREEVLLGQLASRLRENSERTQDMLLSEEGRNVYREVLLLQREWLLQRNKEHNITAEVINRHLLVLDLEQEKLEHI
ncbi:Na+/H+ antiporter [Flavobacterium sp. F52]|uniref:Na+/H+ antiporter n=1 Tax=Flavobacterium sp. F52 TaxID=1202532 RepID=UPI000272DBEE|nr:Na+/H+ antiporter [Flavobacterium sp. F52]EJG03200.1 Na+/H+ antiporter [Flavobacterium sp. F52]